MPKLSFSATWLALFTSPEHAQSIEGDLLEEAESRGRVWFWSHLVQTTLALWGQGFRASPFSLLGLTVVCAAAWVLPVVLGEIDDSPGLVVFGPLLAGFIFVRVASVRGIYAAVAVAFAAGLIMPEVYLLTHRPVEGITDLARGAWYGVVTVVPLLLGSLLAQRQVVKKRSPAR